MKYPMPASPTPPKDWGLYEFSQDKICASPATLEYLVDVEIWMRKIKVAPVWSNP